MWESDEIELRQLLRNARPKRDERQSKKNSVDEGLSDDGSEGKPPGDSADSEHKGSRMLQDKAEAVIRSQMTKIPESWAKRAFEYVWNMGIVITNARAVRIKVGANLLF